MTGMRKQGLCAHKNLTTFLDFKIKQLHVVPIMNRESHAGNKFCTLKEMKRYILFCVHKPSFSQFA